MLDMTPGDMTAEERFAFDQDRFLSSHRALSVCTREFERMTRTAAQRATELARDEGLETPEVRLTPNRCIVQLGPVAMTFVWMRSTLDTVAEGRLLAMVWKGQIAQRKRLQPERTTTGAAPTAAPVWEEVLAAGGTNEDSWEWRPEQDTTRHYDSSQLADRCITELRTALASCAA